MTYRLLIYTYLIAVGVTSSCYAYAQKVDNAASLTEKAAVLLDNYSGDTRQLIVAKSTLVKAIRLEPAYPQAHVELARYYIKSGHINYRNFQPGTLQAAEQSLNTALELDPNHANAYVLLGHLYMLMGKEKEARKALEKAETIGTDNPWLHMNWADVLEWEGKHDKKMAHYRLLIEQGTVNNNALAKAYRGLINYHNERKEYQISRKMHQDIIDLDPKNAWSRGSYGFDLLHIMGDADSSIEQYKSALSLMNYGAGRFGLANAYLGKWAKLVETNTDSKVSDEFYTKAMRLYSDKSTIVVKSGEYLATHYIVKALIKYKNASIDSKDEKGDTALTLAAYTGKVPEIYSLVKMGANMELGDGNGFTPLMLAAYRGHLPAVKALIKSGADKNKINGKFTATTIAKRYGRTSIVSYLQSIH